MSPFNLTTAAAALVCPRCTKTIPEGTDYFSVVHTYVEPHLCLWCATADMSKMVGGILPVMPLSFIKKLLRQQRLRELLGRPIESIQAAIIETQETIQSVFTDAHTAVEAVITEILPDQQEKLV